MSQAPEGPFDHVGILNLKRGAGDQLDKDLQVGVELMLQISG